MWGVGVILFWGEMFFSQNNLLNFRCASFSGWFEWNVPQQLYKVRIFAEGVM